MGWENCRSEGARPPFALEHLYQHDAEHPVYHILKPRPDGPRVLVLTPLELIDKIAALVPPPRVHRDRYYGVLARTAAHRKFSERSGTAGFGRTHPLMGRG